VGHSQWVSTQQVIDQSGGGTQGGWGWPFAAPFNNSNGISGGQLFGYTRTVPPFSSPFHDGVDFGSNYYSDHQIRAVHSGTISKLIMISLLIFLMIKMPAIGYHFQGLDGKRH
jgi:hypothetical protein